MSLAKVTIVGNLGRDPETRYTPNGRMNVSFSIAVNRKWNDAGGNLQEKVTWFRITAWGRVAEQLDRLTQQGALQKGREVLVTGNIEQRDWTDQNGQTRSNLEVTADDVRLIGGPREQRGGNAPADHDPDGADMDDVPF